MFYKRLMLMTVTSLTEMEAAFLMTRVSYSPLPINVNLHESIMGKFARFGSTLTEPQNN